MTNVKEQLHKLAETLHLRTPPGVRPCTSCMSASISPTARSGRPVASSTLPKMLQTASAVVEGRIVPHEEVKKRFSRT